MKKHQRFVIENKDFELFRKLCAQKEFTMRENKGEGFKLDYEALKAVDTNLCPTFNVFKSEGKLEFFLQKFSKKYPWLLILLCFVPILGFFIPIELMFPIEISPFFRLCLLIFVSAIIYTFSLLLYTYHAKKAYEQLLIVQQLIRKHKEFVSN